MAIIKLPFHLFVFMKTNGSLTGHVHILPKAHLFWPWRHPRAAASHDGNQSPAKAERDQAAAPGESLPRQLSTAGSEFLQNRGWIDMATS